MPHLRFKSLTGPLPTSTFDLMEANMVIGCIQIRHQPSHSIDVPANMESHIFYEIDPAYRGKGFGRKILELGPQEAKKLGLNEVMVTCDEDNLPSKKIIEANG